MHTLIADQRSDLEASLDRRPEFYRHLLLIELSDEGHLSVPQSDWATNTLKSALQGAEKLFHDVYPKCEYRYVLDGSTTTDFNIVSWSP